MAKNNNNFDIAKYQKYARQKLQKGGGIKTSYVVGLWVDKSKCQHHIATGCFENITNGDNVAITVDNNNVIISKLSKAMQDNFDKHNLGYYHIDKQHNYVVIGNGKLFEDIKKIYSNNGKFAIKTYSIKDKSSQDVVKHIMQHTVVKDMQ